MEQPRLLLNQPPGPLVVLAVPGRACLVWQAAQVLGVLRLVGGGRCAQRWRTLAAADDS